MHKGINSIMRTMSGIVDKKKGLLSAITEHNLPSVSVTKCPSQEKQEKEIKMNEVFTVIM